MSEVNLSFRQQVALALLTNQKDLVPSILFDTDILEFLGDEEPPANHSGKTQVRARCLAVALDIYVDAIVKQIGNY